MTRPGKIPSQAEFELRTFRFRSEQFDHLAYEAVGGGGWRMGGEGEGAVADVCGSQVWFGYGQIGMRGSAGTLLGDQALPLLP